MGLAGQDRCETQKSGQEQLGLLNFMGILSRSPHEDEIHNTGYTSTKFKDILQRRRYSTRTAFSTPSSEVMTMNYDKLSQRSFRSWPHSLCCRALPYRSLSQSNTRHHCHIVHFVLLGLRRSAFLSKVLVCVISASWFRNKEKDILIRQGVLWALRARPLIGRKISRSVNGGIRDIALSLVVVH